jgi:hypothetical protein
MWLPLVQFLRVRCQAPSGGKCVFSRSVIATADVLLTSEILRNRRSTQEVSGSNQPLMGALVQVEE